MHLLAQDLFQLQLRIICSGKQFFSGYISSKYISYLKCRILQSISWYFSWRILHEIVFTVQVREVLRNVLNMRREIQFLRVLRSTFHCQSLLIFRDHMICGVYIYNLTQISAQVVQWSRLQRTSPYCGLLLGKYLTLSRHFLNWKNALFELKKWTDK